MGLGVRLHTMWRLRGGVALSAVLGVLAAVWSLFHVSLVPPRLEPRSTDLATASTHVLVDTPRSALLDLGLDTYGLEVLTNQAVLLGNVMADGTVERDIARRTGIPVAALRVTPPLTPRQPRVPPDADHPKRASDLLASTDQYRLNVQANPTVPVLDIYAQSPSAASARALADNAVTALQHYLASLAAAQGTPAGGRIRLVQLGRARGSVVDHGAAWQIAVLAFAFTFLTSCATVLYVSRVRQGWRSAVLSERAAGA